MMSVGVGMLHVLLLSFLACNEQKSALDTADKKTVEQGHVSEQETKKRPVEMVVVEKKEEAFSSSEPLSIQIDTHKISVMFSQFFRAAEAQEILFTGLEGRIGGAVKITTHPPIYEERKKPKIILHLSDVQFAGLTPRGPSGMDTTRLVQILETLNQYRKHIGNHSEQRVFHFFIGVAVQDCVYFPSDQEPFVAVTKIDSCVQYKEEKICGEQIGMSIAKLPQDCRPIPKK